MPEEEYIPKRGDILQNVGRDSKIGIVIGWITTDFLQVQNIKTKEVTISSFRGNFIVLIKRDQYEALISALPRTIELTDTEP